MWRFLRLLLNVVHEVGRVRVQRRLGVVALAWLSGCIADDQDEIPDRMAIQAELSSGDPAQCLTHVALDIVDARSTGPRLVDNGGSMACEQASDAPDGWDLVCDDRNGTVIDIHIARDLRGGHMALDYIGLLCGWEIASVTVL